jgi:hypothetical protein
MLHSASRRLQLLLHEDTPTTASGSTSGPTSGPASGPTLGPTSGPASGQAVQHQDLPLVQPAALLWDQLADPQVLVQLWVPPPDQPVAQCWDLLLDQEQGDFHVQEVLFYSSAARTFHSINVPLSLIEQYIYFTYFSSLTLDQYHCQWCRQCWYHCHCFFRLCSDFAHVEATTSCTRNGLSVVWFSRRLSWSRSAFLLICS